MDYCKQSLTAFTTATSLGGVCQSCPAQGPDPAGCATQCPLCVNALNNYLAACAVPGVSSSDADGAIGSQLPPPDTATITGFANQLPDGRACTAYLLSAASTFATPATCSDAFDFVLLQYSTAVQSARNPDVPVADGQLVVPYSCLQATAASCPASCQSDLSLLAGSCDAEDLVQWGGLGTDASDTAASKGTTVSAAQAFVYFQKGMAAQPINVAYGVSSGPFAADLSACQTTTPSFWQSSSVPAEAAAQ